MKAKDLKIGEMYYCTQDNQYCLYLRCVPNGGEYDEYWFWFFKDNEELHYLSRNGELDCVREL